MKDLVKYMAQALVDYPDDVECSEVVGEQTSVIELRVAKGDLGKGYRKTGENCKGDEDHLERRIIQDSQEGGP